MSQYIESNLFKINNIFILLYLL